MLGERACMHVCVPANLSSSRSLFPSTCFIPSLPSSHTIFFLHSTNTGFSLGGQSRGLIYCTVELWDGNASQHKVADGRVCQPSAAMAGDALRVLQMEMICLFFFKKGWSSDVRSFDTRCRLRGDQSAGRPSRAAEGQFLTREEKEK